MVGDRWPLSLLFDSLRRGLVISWFLLQLFNHLAPAFGADNAFLSRAYDRLLIPSLGPHETSPVLLEVTNFVA